jgi:hypothetical protein
LRSVFVSAKRSGHVVVTDQRGDVAKFSPFDGRVDLDEVPAHSGAVVTIFYNKLPEKDERIVINSEPTGKEEYPYSSFSLLVSAWYQRAFWVAIIVICLLIVLMVKPWNWDWWKWWKRGKATPIPAQNASTAKNETDTKRKRKRSK